MTHSGASTQPCSQYDRCKKIVINISAGFVAWEKMTNLQLTVQGNHQGFSDLLTHNSTVYRIQQKTKPATIIYLLANLFENITIFKILMSQHFHSQRNDKNKSDLYLEDKRELVIGGGPAGHCRGHVQEQAERLLHLLRRLSRKEQCNN